MRLNLFQWLAATAALVALGWYERHEPWTVQHTLGALICLLSFGLVSVARYQLGRAFSVRAQAHHLVTTGLYARFRNPIYVFAEFFLAGLALYLNSWWLLLTLVALIPIQVARAAKEAAVLQAAFGEAYTAYRARTWF